MTDTPKPADILPIVVARVRLTLDCPECASAVPVNGMVDDVLCSSCQCVVKLEDDFAWSELLSYASHESCMEHRILVKTSPVKAMDYYLAFGPEGGRLYRKYRQILLEVDNRPMSCPGCKAPLDAEALGLEIQKEGREVDAFCPACGDAIPIRVPTRRERASIHPSCIAIVGESALRGELGEAPSQDIVLFSCLGCGAPLDVDQKVPRMLPCRFCDATNYLPDALWLRLHPASRKRPFFFLMRADANTHARARAQI